MTFSPVPTLVQRNRVRSVPSLGREGLCILIVLFSVTGCSQAASYRKQEQETNKVSNIELGERREYPKSTNGQGYKRPVLKPKEDRGFGYLVYARYDEIEQIGKVNTGNPTTTVHYVNPEQGISIDLPFNPEWGTEKFSIDPFSEHEQRVVFGPLRGCEGGGLCREHAIYFLPQKPVREILKELEKSSGENNQPTITENTIGGLTVIQKKSSGFCDYVKWYIIGKKRNYLLSACEDEIILEHYEDIVRSITLLD